jgi:hypothetical protein
VYRADNVSFGVALTNDGVESDAKNTNELYRVSDLRFGYDDLAVSPMRKMVAPSCEIFEAFLGPITGSSRPLGAQ